MTRSFTVRRQRESSLRDLLDNMKSDNCERSYCKWIIAAIIFTLTCDLLYYFQILASTSSTISTLISWQRRRKPMKLPHLGPRSAWICAVCSWRRMRVRGETILRSTPEMDTNGTAQPTASSTRQVLPDPREDSSRRTEVQAVTLPQIVDVRYSQPQRYKLWKNSNEDNNGQKVLPCVIRLAKRHHSSHSLKYMGRKLLFCKWVDVMVIVGQTKSACLLYSFFPEKWYVHFNCLCYVRMK
jgi:hypothetical protein